MNQKKKSISDPLYEKCEGQYQERLKEYIQDMESQNNALRKVLNSINKTSIQQKPATDRGQMH